MPTLAMRRMLADRMRGPFDTVGCGRYTYVNGTLFGMQVSAESEDKLRSGLSTLAEFVDPGREVDGYMRWLEGLFHDGEPESTRDLVESIVYGTQVCDLGPNGNTAHDGTDEGEVLTDGLVETWVRDADRVVRAEPRDGAPYNLYTLYEAVFRRSPRSWECIEDDEVRELVDLVVLELCNSDGRDLIAPVAEVVA